MKQNKIHKSLSGKNHLVKTFFLNLLVFFWFLAAKKPLPARNTASFTKQAASKRKIDGSKEAGISWWN